MVMAALILATASADLAGKGGGGAPPLARAPASVRGAEDSALLVRPVGMAHARDEDHVGVRGMDDEAPAADPASSSGNTSTSTPAEQ